MRFVRLILFALAMLGAVTSLTGCVTMTQPFPGMDPDRAWVALVAAAETPDYSDVDPTRRWFVKENHVSADRENATIEVFRRLDRVLQRPGTRPLRQQQRWRFTIELESGVIPIATFTSRGAGVPAHAYAEGERYFADVRRLMVEQVSGTFSRPSLGSAMEGSGDRNR